jgi:hypothetical protein
MFDSEGGEFVDQSKPMQCNDTYQNHQNNFSYFMVVTSEMSEFWL